MQANDEGRIVAYIAGFTLPTVFYLSRKELEKLLGPQQAIIKAFDDVRICLVAFQVCNINRQVLEQALRLGGDDYEDNLQVACAKAYNLDAIVTRDKKFQRGSIAILSPAELLKRVAKQKKRR